MHYQLTKVSNNKKTGPIAVSTSSAATCPTACPFNHQNQGGCYAEAGPLAMHWRKVTAGERGGNLEQFASEIRAIPRGSLWRHNQAGDLPGDGETIDGTALQVIVDANKGRKGFTYTHYDPSNAANLAAISLANMNGFTVNLSGNSLDHAAELKRSHPALPVVAVAPAEHQGNKGGFEHKGVKMTYCPATYRDDVSCASCGLCASRKADRPVVVFPAHGTSKRKASKVAGA